MPMTTTTKAFKRRGRGRRQLSLSKQAVAAQGGKPMLPPFYHSDITMITLLVRIMCQRWLSPKLVNFLEFNCSHYGSANCWEDWFGQQMTSGHLWSNGNNSNWTTNSVPANNCPHRHLVRGEMHRRLHWWGHCLSVHSSGDNFPARPGSQTFLLEEKKHPCLLDFWTKYILSNQRSLIWAIIEHIILRNVGGCQKVVTEMSVLVCWSSRPVFGLVEKVLDKFENNCGACDERHKLG